MHRNNLHRAVTVRAALDSLLSEWQRQEGQDGQEGIESSATHPSSNPSSNHSNFKNRISVLYAITQDMLLCEKLVEKEKEKEEEKEKEKEAATACKDEGLGLNSNFCSYHFILYPNK